MHVYGTYFMNSMITNKFSLFVQYLAVEQERTKKWLKMLKVWDKYYPSEKVNDRF